MKALITVLLLTALTAMAGSTLAAPNDRPADEQKITLITGDWVDARDILRQVAAHTGLGLQLAPDVSGQVNVHLEDVPLRQALAALLEPVDLGYEIIDGVLIVFKRGMVTRWYTLRLPGDQARGQGRARGLRPASGQPGQRLLGQRRRQRRRRFGREHERPVDLVHHGHLAAGHRVAADRRLRGRRGRGRSLRRPGLPGHQPLRSRGPRPGGQRHGGPGAGDGGVGPGPSGRAAAERASRSRSAARSPSRSRSSRSPCATASRRASTGPTSRASTSASTSSRPRGSRARC